MVARVGVPVADENVEEAIPVEVANRGRRGERRVTPINASLSIEAKDHDLALARGMDEQELVLTIGVQIGRLDVPLLGLDLQGVKIE